ncbi:MAG TPA: hypothetical protein HPP87_09875 [Planctomycetes bacterium]|nr:hypothetical protein [Planctomycetota bacterium]HIJ71655.1 hypothetical protein [Planctomycetota bacterium]
MINRYGSIALLLFVLVIITGCGKSPSETDKNEMVLRHIMPTKVRGLDPGDMRDRYSFTIGSQIFETLYQYHFLKRPYEIVPLLAEEMPLVSDDLLTYTIKIQKGIFYQDDECFAGGKGREVQADDFVYSLKRIANIKYLSQNWSLFDDKIVGLDEFREYTKGCESEQGIDYSRAVEGLQTPDDYTLVIRLKKPWPQMVSTALADLSTAPVAREAVDFYGKDIISNPVGTGPFMLEQWRRGSYFELVRNPNFRGEAYPLEGEPGDAERGYLDDAGRIMPFADKIIWTVILESQPAWFLFLEGKVDSSGIPKDNFGEAITQNMQLTESMHQRNIHLKTFLDPSTFWVGFNMLDSVLGKNKALRLAISRSIAREKFIELFSNNRDMVAHGMVVPLMDSYNPDIRDEGYSKYAPQEAKELLKEAEKVHGGKLPVLKLAVPGTDTFARQYGQFLVRQMTNIGLEVEAQYMDWPTYLEKMNGRSLQMFTSGAHASITDAQDFLQSFYSRNWAPGANNFNYSNPEFDRLYEKAVVMLDGPERRRLYRKMEKIALDDCPAAFLNHRVAYVLHHDWYKNYKPHAFAYGLSKYRRIDLEKRQAYKDLLKKLK